METDERSLRSPSFRNQEPVISVRSCLRCPFIPAWADSSQTRRLAIFPIVVTVTISGLHSSSRQTSNKENMTSSSTMESKSNSFGSAIELIGRILKDVSPIDFWRRVLMASVFPFCGSLLWHYARTEIVVTDKEQSLWIQMWQQQRQQRSALVLRVGRLMLLSPASRLMGHSMERDFGRRVSREEDDDEKEDEGGRFAPPKFDFQPAHGVSVWTWHNSWPISLVSHSTSVGEDGWSGRRQVDEKRGYTLTIWLAPSATRVVKDILLQGRQLWLAKRAKKTEIWLCGGRYRGDSFRVVTRPSRPLSSVIVEGGTKNALRQDAIRFLNSEKWYVGKGIPYRRGFLLFGPPGCGKTSLVTALAGELRLPIVVIPLNSKELDDALLMEMMSKAPKDSIVLIEDIDCALPRGADQQAGANMMARMTGRQPVTFSGLLNAIDGVGAQEGRLLFMTTNHLDRLDEALIRPGRVDVKFHLGKASKAAAGELFDQFFSSSTTIHFSPKIIQRARSAFLTNVQDGKHSFAALQGVLMTARDDPGLVEVGMRNMLESIEAAVTDGKPPSTWETLASIESLSRGALEKEQKGADAQRSAGLTVVKRFAGNALEIKHDFTKRMIVCSSFSTFGAPEKLAESGVLYYEIEIVKAHGCAQFGFAMKNGIEETKENTDIGVGDTGKTWAADGFRQLKWYNGEPLRWSCSWKEGSIVGLAANIDLGQIAVSLDGSWENANDERGFVFENESIKEGVFPCFTASYHKLRYSVDQAHLEHSPPPESVWKVSGESEANK